MLEDILIVILLINGVVAVTVYLWKHNLKMSIYVYSSIAVLWFLALLGDIVPGAFFLLAMVGLVLIWIYDRNKSTSDNKNSQSPMNI